MRHILINFCVHFLLLSSHQSPESPHKSLHFFSRDLLGFFKASVWELEDAEEENVEIVINPDFGQTRSHALAGIGRILEQGSPDQMGHLVIVEVKPWPRIYN